MFLPDELKSLSNQVVSQGGNLYVVGGAVRDSLFGFPVHDYDLLITEVHPEALKLDGFKLDYDPKGRSFPVWHVRGMLTYELALPRALGENQQYTYWTQNTLQGDLNLRDFTYNAMAYDIQNGEIIRCDSASDNFISTHIVSNDVFRHDPIRILRAFRLAGHTGKGISDATDKAMRSALKDYAVFQPDRLKAELEKIFNHEKAEVILDNIIRDDVFHKISKILPPVGIAIQVDSLKNINKMNKGCQWFAFFNSLNLAGVSTGMFDIFNLPIAVRKTVCELFAYQSSLRYGMTEAELRQIMGKMGETEFLNLWHWFCLNSPHTEERLMPLVHVCLSNPTHSIKNLAVNGDDLGELAQGPALGVLLTKLLIMVQKNPKLNDRDSLMAVAEAIVET